MKKIAVSLRIDVTKIDKARLYKGAKGTYLDAVAFINLDEVDQYGYNGMITQSVSKEEKEAGVQGPILGNDKVIWSSEGQATQALQPAPRPQQSQQAAPPDFDDDIPFAKPHWLTLS